MAGEERARSLRFWVKPGHSSCIECEHEGKIKSRDSKVPIAGCPGHSKAFRTSTSVAVMDELTCTTTPPI